MNSKVHYSWLGSNSKKTYLILSVENRDTPSKTPDKNNTFLARLLGILVALWMSDLDKVHIWMDLIIKLFE